MCKKSLVLGVMALMLGGMGTVSAGDIDVNNDTQWNVAIGGTGTSVAARSPIISGTAGARGGTAWAGSVEVVSNCDCKVDVDNATQYNLAIGNASAGSVHVTALGNGNGPD